MFLTLNAMSAFQLKVVQFAATAILLLFCCTHSACAAQKDCVIQFAVYDPAENSLDFRVTRVSAEKGGQVDLLQGSPKIFTVQGNLLSFSDRRILGRSLEIQLEGPKGAKLSRTAVVAACRLRFPIFYGVFDSGSDVNGIFVKGRVSGCSFRGDWWVRSFPMFGGHEGWADYPVDAFVESDGTFSLVLGALGVRRILVVGRGKEPLKAVAINVTQGKNSDVGVIELKGLCPMQ
jgi:hypothetical protein